MILLVDLIYALNELSYQMDILNYLDIKFLITPERVG